MKVEAVPAEETDEPTLRNLLQLYLHDLSEFESIEVSDEGEFRYPYLSNYWAEPGRYAYLLMVDDALAGFALVKSGSELVGDDWAKELAEFFVLRKYRHKGVGRTVATHLFAMFPGPWVVAVIQQNRDAAQFWDHVISGSAVRELNKVAINDGKRDWVVFQFEFSESTSDRASG